MNPPFFGGFNLFVRHISTAILSSSDCAGAESNPPSVFHAAIGLKIFPSKRCRLTAGLFGMADRGRFHVRVGRLYPVMLYADLNFPFSA